MYIGGPQWRHIDLNGAFFAQSGGGKATFFFHWNEICLKPLGFPARRLSPRRYSCAPVS